MRKADMNQPSLSIIKAVPFWCSLILIPLIWWSAVTGGWAVVVTFVVMWFGMSLADIISGQVEENPDPDNPGGALVWYRVVNLIWFPLQAITVFGLIWYVTHTDHLGGWEKYGLFVSVGVMSGSIGITYAHELIHQNSRHERLLGDLLLANVLYSHFRTDHLLVHHRYVGTPKDPVTARYNEGLYRYMMRVLPGGYKSAWQAETQRLQKRGLPVWHHKNPFWFYGALQLVALCLAIGLGGWVGLALFLLQAFVAAWHLETINYIEHYGLTRRHLGDGKYEHVQPHHSWNTDYRTTNWMLINLQRHSDHHYKPARRFPLLQTYPEDEAPQLPHGYAVMGLVAPVPTLWRRMMNPRVRAWRKLHYPDIEDWTPYRYMSNPMPK